MSSRTPRVSSTATRSRPTQLERRCALERTDARSTPGPDVTTEEGAEEEAPPEPTLAAPAASAEACAYHASYASDTPRRSSGASIGFVTRTTARTSGTPPETSRSPVVSASGASRPSSYTSAGAFASGGRDASRTSSGARAADAKKHHQSAHARSHAGRRRRDETRGGPIARARDRTERRETTRAATPERARGPRSRSGRRAEAARRGSRARDAMAPERDGGRGADERERTNIFELLRAARARRTRTKLTTANSAFFPSARSHLIRLATPRRFSARFSRASPWRRPSSSPPSSSSRTTPPRASGPPPRTAP